MNVILFDKNDKDYINWMETNPSGFVVNTRRSKTANYFMIHASGCTHIKDYGDLKKGAFTGQQWVKICSNSSEQLQIWLFEQKSNFNNLNKCKTCLRDGIPEMHYMTSENRKEEEQKVYYDGAPNLITRIEYERNPDARKKCLDHHGYSCAVCKFNFEERFGDIGKNYIHVHHLTPLFYAGGIPYRVNPLKDLIPVCPNCHAMLHIKNTLRTVGDLKKIIAKKQASKVKPTKNLYMLYLAETD